jgi:hypothetical protein
MRKPEMWEVERKARLALADMRARAQAAGLHG